MKYLYLAILATLSMSTSGHTNDIQLVLTKPDFEIMLNGYASQNVNFDTLTNGKIFNLTYWGESPKAEIKYGDEVLIVTYRDAEIQKIRLKLADEVKTISFNIQGPPAKYDAQYIQTHAAKVSVDIPAVYELNNIVLALADKFHHTNYRMHTKGQYYDDVITWFAPYKDHALFKQLDSLDYYSFIENGPAYAFVGNKIQNIGVYSGFRAKDTVLDNISQLEDFAKKSRFQDFYKQHQAYYSALRHQFQLATQPERIWRWLEFHFPARYQSYKIFFSPLGPGNNSARMFDNNNFKESLIFISSPNRYENDEGSPTIKMTRSFFTEIDHTYVNPISDQYINEINSAINDPKPWYRGGGYNRPYSIFNEYMTWSIFSLYAMEHYSAAEFNYTKSYIEKFMEEKRGFFKFTDFNNEMTRLYKNKSPEQKITDLFPKIIAWMNNNP